MFIVITLILFVSIVLLSKYEEDKSGRIRIAKWGKDSDRSESESLWYCVGVLFIILSIITVGVGFLVNVVAYTGQIKNFENVRMVNEVEKIYTEKAAILTTEFKLYLASEYPEHELKIFDNMKPDNVNMYAAMFPQIRASETISLLVNKINQLQDDIYNQQVLRAGIMRDIRFRLVNPWLVGWIMPNIPSEFEQENPKK